MEKELFEKLVESVMELSDIARVGVQPFNPQKPNDPYRVNMRRELFHTTKRHAFAMDKATPAKRAKWLRLVKYRMRAMTGKRRSQITNCS